MFRAILYTQWKWSRGVLLLGTLAAFAVPMIGVNASYAQFDQVNPQGVLRAMAAWGQTYALAACGIGLAAALLAWSADHAGRHVYALALPVERWRYVGMRFGAGATLLIAPIVALGLGAVVALAGINVPSGLRAYPFALTFRFALAVMLAYAVFFAVSSVTRRTAGYLVTVVAAVFAIELVGQAMNIRTSHIQILLDAAASGLGILYVFTGRWMLIDV